jgi:acyl transferase domain-containing protein/acyl carrier protein
MSDLDHFDSRIAVIGMSGRFPGAATLDQYWLNLCQGVDTISRTTVIQNGQRKIRALGMLRDVDLFDASFFNFTPKEAEITDPQHRIFLEVAWEALEDAGYGSENYRGSVGIFAGASGSRYGQMLYANPALMNYLGEIYAYLGNEKDFLATRVSYKLNLSGPSVVVQTACSTALVATHLACQSLLNGECDLAMAGGVSLMRATKNNPEADSTVEEISTNGNAPNDGGVISPEGYCRAFDANASGTIGGEAAGVIVLKRLSEAQKDGDFIHAVIRGSAMNNDGARKFGFTAPSVEGQASVITEALALSGVDPETIHYVEAHGTGTPLGDPVEVAALSQVFQKRTGKKGFCAIGSVKTNIGHTDAAAGVCGLMKTALALKHGLIPPSLHYEKPNPEIDFENSPFFVNQVLREWPRNGSPRRAGVSSFGIGGTNVHLILEEAPAREAPGKSRAHSLYVLSAKTPGALESATANLAHHVETHPELDLADAAYTLQIGRKECACRRIVVAGGREELIHYLKDPNSPNVLTAVFSATSRPVTFLFPKSAQPYANAGRDLYDEEPVFREAVDLISQAAQSRFGIDPRSSLYPDEKEFAKTHQAGKPEASWFALFTMEYALARLWMSWGVFPDFVAGEGPGEYVAACVAEVLSVNDALDLMAGKVRRKTSINGHALHTESSSTLPDQQLMSKIKLNAPKILCFSTLTSDWIADSEALDPGYWLKHLHAETRIADSLQELLADPDATLLEVGPGQTMALLIKSHPALQASQLVLSSLPDASNSSPELLKTAGQLWLNGTALDWVQFHAGERRRRIPLPAYPFERQSYWLDFERTLQPAVASEAGEAAAKPSENAASALEKESPGNWFYLPSWQRSLMPNARRPEAKACWLAFIEPSTIGEKTAARLEQEGSRVIRVSRGAQFVRQSECSYWINPRQPGDYVELLKQVAIPPDEAVTVLHGWSLAPDDSGGYPWERFEQAQYLSSYSLLFTAQAFGKQWPDRPLRMEVLSQGVQVVAEAQSAGPEKAAVSGVMEVIAKEHPNVICRNVDVDGAGSQERMLQLILREIKAEASESVVALRGNRFVCSFERVKVPAPAGLPTLVRTGGVYLITNVSGEAGLSFARYLAKTVRPKLVFIASAGFPEKNKWSLWKATSDPNAPVSRAIGRLQEIERLGAEVLVQQAETGDPDQLKRAVAATREHFGALHGVIHEAQFGERRSFRMVRDVDALFCSRHLQAKAKELLTLEAALEAAPLDFILLLAPLAPLFGEAGRCADAATANFFQAYAPQRDSAGPVRWIAMNFAPALLQEPETVSIAAQGREGSGAAASDEIWARIASGSVGTQIIVSEKDFRPDLKRTPVQAQAMQAPAQTVQAEAIISAEPKVQAEAKIEPASQPEHTATVEVAGVVKTAPVQNETQSPPAGPQPHAPQPEAKGETASAHAGNEAALKGHPAAPAPAPVQEKMQKPQAGSPAGGPNGKDAAAAATPQGVVLPPLHPRPNLNVPFVAPGTEAQKSIAAIWQELLRLKEVGIRDDFFQLGGDSLVATQMISRLRTHFQVELPLRYFFEYPTIESMEKAIHNAKKNGVSAQKPAISRVARNERGKAPAAAAKGTPEILQEASSNGRR